MIIVLCNNLLQPNKPDEDFVAEYQSAKNAGLEAYLISLERLREGDIAGALRRIPVMPGKQTVIYRGWMLRPKEYEKLYASLMEKNWQLINSPIQYLNGHYFPNSYAKIKDYSPKSIYFENNGEVDFSYLLEKLQIFGKKPVVLKDFVKSEKHYWEEACYISSASDEEAVRKVTNRFLELRGNFLNEGLVYREFVELEKLTHHTNSRMPIAKEFRLFYFNGRLVDCSPYWGEGEYDQEQPDFELFNQIASQIESNFFTMDVAKQTNGKWVIMELGDGQVSGLPDDLDIDLFYRKLAT